MLMLFLEGCAPEATRTFTPPPAPKPVLQLSAKAQVLQAGEAMAISASFSNEGSAPLTVLKPIDGAGDGMRCVSYQWKVVRADGTAITPKGYGRCGNTNSISEKDFATLAPGARTAIGPDWLSAPEMKLDLSPPGVYRVQLIYSFKLPEGELGPAPFGGGTQPGRAQELLKETAVVTVESNWLEITRQ